MGIKTPNQKKKKTPAPPMGEGDYNIKQKEYYKRKQKEL